MNRNLPQIETLSKLYEIGFRSVGFLSVQGSSGQRLSKELELILRKLQKEMMEQRK